jgi:peptide methionine sulfoxide reductase MsrA
MLVFEMCRSLFAGGIFWCKMKNFEDKSEIIYCPQCGRRVGFYDGKSTIDVVASCRKCRKRVVYHVDTGKVELKELPKRNCSSGLQFR